MTQIEPWPGGAARTNTTIPALLTCSSFAAFLELVIAILTVSKTMLFFIELMSHDISSMSITEEKSLKNHHDIAYSPRLESSLSH